jgi:regulator of protease activity HflC (stomatin/prohibitin superfamily)
MTKVKLLLGTLLLFTLFIGQSCVTIKQGEVGVKRKFGKFSDTGYTQGLKVYNPLVSRIIKISTQTENLEVGLNIPSKEGLNILSEVSILYRVDPKQAPELLRNIGTEYEANVILPIFRSAVSDVSANYFAKDMHTGERSNIEKEIKGRMDSYLESKGIYVDAVLLKSIQLPRSLAAAIEDKLEAEQQAQRMEFVLNQAERQAEQKRIEAKGIRDAQIIIAEGLDEKVLQFKSIEAFEKLATSPNAKVVVSDGDMPIILDNK